jgi:hypothetical protein
MLLLALGTYAVSGPVAFFADASLSALVIK